ncbi:hypothetical protein [Noviherbaspirillum soli]|uniref:hypothetical protein n=1 Tax=Noviherbaspirillum soli TaxID=1064518 RepID=UPI00188D5DBD|nr:hypothetical protein [Noviherbaspirillum soli]
MREQFWHQTFVSLGIVAVVMAITFLASQAALKRQHAWRTYDTYVLGDGIVNSVSITLDVKLTEAERRRILVEYAKVLATYAPAFNPNSALDVRPIP